MNIASRRKRMARTENCAKLLMLCIACLASAWGQPSIQPCTNGNYSSDLCLSSTSANLGIGTQAPPSPLTIQTSATGTNTLLQNIFGTADPGAGATILRIANYSTYPSTPLDFGWLAAWGSGAPGILQSSVGLVSRQGPLVLGTQNQQPLYLFAGAQTSSAPPTQFTLSTNGYVGLGIAQPAYQARRRERRPS